MRTDREAPPAIAGRMRGLRAEERRAEGYYGLALLLILASIVVLIIAGEQGTLTGVAAGVLQSFALAVTLRISGARHATVLAIYGFVLGGAVVAGLLAAGLDLDDTTVFTLLWLVVVAITPVSVARRLLRTDRIDVGFILGVLVIYLMLGLVFAYLYMFVGAVAPPAFNLTDANRGDAVYYSYITLATVGYGDITPANSVVRALAVAEALVGQLYLVSVVALSVGAFGRRRFDPQDPSDRDPSH